MKKKKTTWVLLCIKCNKFWSVLLEHFIERKPLIIKECCSIYSFVLRCVVLYVTFRRVLVGQLQLIITERGEFCFLKATTCCIYFSGGPNRTEFTEYRSFGSVLFGSVRFGEIQEYRTESFLLLISIFEVFRDLF